MEMAAYSKGKDFLVAKYGTIVRQKVHWVGGGLHNRASVWWKDICRIDIKEDGSWFANNVKRVIGNGQKTRFWLDCWMGNAPLCERFPRLFSISSHKEGVVSEYWREKDRVCRGEWGWRRRLFVWEHALLVELSEALPILVLSDDDDDWRWSLEDLGNFTVKSAYLLLSSIFATEGEYGSEELRVFNNIWKSPAPSKVITFSWKLLRNRVPTRINLVHRGVNVDGGGCELCALSKLG
jgi:hypothetical protein